TLLALLYTLHDLPEGPVQTPVLSHLLPALRADLTALGTWKRHARAPLALPITAFGGDRDATCPAANLAEWRQETTGDFARHIHPGGHFYLDAHSDAVLGLILQTAGLVLPPLRRRSTPVPGVLT
ncbi:thioesterase domain-containing protein, partial [Rhizobium sp. TRM95111]|uniref:thioesterase II family protein n=1 Tax=Rhizobium alarense TaxID=2846851 RepID=UPI001F457164